MVMDIEFQLTSSPITSTAGLAFIGDHLKETKLSRHLSSVCPHVRKSGRIADIDVAKSMIGLLCLGKPDFDAIGEYRDEPFFTRSLGLGRLPSPETLRQRIACWPDKTCEVWRNFNIRQLRRNKKYLTEKIHGHRYAAVDVDVSPMDNSDTKKEGVSWTYKKFDGYAPIFAYIGPGFMLNNELRPGSAHSNHEGTGQWIGQTLQMARKITDDPILFTADSGNDSTDNVAILREQPKTDFILKRNLRKQDPAEWLALAKEQTGEENYEEVDIGARAWYGQEEVALPGQDDVPEDKQVKQRVVFRATWRFARPDGVTAQYVTDPQITIDAYWTSLDWTPQQIQAFYQKRGTSEQYHSELKSDMDLERLPSGKFATNQQILYLAMIAYNLLRMLGRQMLETGLVPGRKARSRRLRLRTVMQNLMYMAGRLVRHARRCILHIFKGHGWALPVMALARSPD